MKLDKRRMPTYIKRSHPPFVSRHGSVAQNFEGSERMTHYVETDGAKVAYRVEGTGPALMLLHGTGGNSETNWSQVVGSLAHRHTVIRPDYSGSGKTVDDGRTLTVPMLAAQAVAAAEQARATPFDLVGFSLGGSIAIYIAAEYPHLVRSVTLLSGFLSSADTRQKLQWELWRDLIRLDRSAMARFLLLTGFSPDFLAGMAEQDVAQILQDLLATNNWDGLARQVELDLTLDVREQARRIAKPVLVIGCTHDYMVPPALSRSLAEIIPNSRYVEIATGHLSTVERPDQVAHSILDFVSNDFNSPQVSSVTHSFVLNPIELRNASDDSVVEQDC
jgi:3-oxoadipate enol-lactonase